MSKLISIIFQLHMYQHERVNDDMLYTIIVVFIL